MIFKNHCYSTKAIESMTKKKRIYVIQITSFEPYLMHSNVSSCLVSVLKYFAPQVNICVDLTCKKTKPLGSGEQSNHQSYLS